MDCEVLFGKKRIASYLNAKEHSKNLRLIARITPRLAVAELILRNKLDALLCERFGNDWFLKPEFEKYRKGVNKSHLTHYQCLSRLNLGEINELIQANTLGFILAREFKTDDLDVKKLAKSNKALQKTRYLLPTAVKFYLVLELLRVLRNRSFHWENLLKVNGKTPRIRAFTKSHKYVLGLHPESIEYFLDFVLSSVDERLLEEFKTHP